MTMSRNLCIKGALS